MLRRGLGTLLAAAGIESKNQHHQHQQRERAKRDRTLPAAHFERQILAQHRDEGVHKNLRNLANLTNLTSVANFVRKLKLVTKPAA